MRGQRKLFGGEWDTLPLSAIASIRDSRVEPSDLGGRTLCVELEHIGQGSGRLIGSSTAERVSSKCRFEVGDILFGRLRPYLQKWWHADRPGVCSTEIWPLVPDSSRADSTFLYALVQAGQLYEAANVSYGTHMPRADWGVVAEVELPLPPLPEQRAIAAVLRDVDALLGSLEALIAKKRAINQAAMQQILTGRTRLPGLGGEWETGHLGELAHITTGSRNNEDKRRNGQYPFFVRSESIERIDSYGYDCEAILVPGEGRIGDIFHYVHGRFDVHQRVYVITDFARPVLPKFLYFYMAECFGPHAMQNTVKATVDSLRLPTFQQFPVPLPSLPEQRAIAAVLADMDAEIAALERRIDKTRAVKQGMMHQLLSGSIRLPIPEAAAEDESIR